MAAGSALPGLAAALVSVAALGSPRLALGLAAAAIAVGITVALVSARFLRATRREIGAMVAAAERAATGETESQPSFAGPDGPGSRDAAALDDALELLTRSAAEREQLLRSQLLQVHEVDQLRDELVSTVSHELRTPLTALRGSLGLVLHGATGELPPRAIELLRIAEQNTERLIRLTTGILDSERLEWDDQPLRLVACDAGALLRSTADALEPMASARGVTIVVDGPTPAPITGDQDRLVQVFTNLFANAIRYSPPGERVRATARVDDGTVRVTVADRGPGIAPEFRPRIFGRFQRAEDASDIAHGAGLGLSISRSIVERHGGTIAFDCGPAGGTTFTVTVPTSSANDNAGESTGDEHRILIVDGDGTMLRVLHGWFEGLGAVTGVRSADDAWPVVEQWKPDAIVIDVPDRESPEAAFVRRVRASAAADRTPVLLFSSRPLAAAVLQELVLAPSHAFVKSQDRERDLMLRLTAVLQARRPR